MNRAIARGFLPLVLAVLINREAPAQGAINGTIVSQTRPRSPIAGAVVMVSGLRATSDSAGNFRLQPLKAGDHWLLLRASGFAPDSFLVEVGPNENISRDFLLRPSIPVLEGVSVTADATPHVPANLAGFIERRRNGIGRFLDRAAIEKFDTRRAADMYATIPGIDVKRGRASKAWASGGRAVSGNKCAFCTLTRAEVLDWADAAAGAPLACYMDVYVDGALVYNSSALKTSLFDLNSIPASEIEAVEVYASAAQIPAQYNRTAGGCGVLLIWTRTG
ncbi:MAG: carboxypeptidase regulatory-like domain-containing protein [Gemmatimonadota bacterium]